MKLKLLLSSLCLLTLASCGGDAEEEIVYQEGPIEMPSEYVLTADDTAPAFYVDVLNGVLANSIYVPEEEEVFEEILLDEETLTDEEKALLEAHAAILAEEAAAAAAIKAAESALAQEELTLYNNRISSIMLVSFIDPTEKNEAALAEAQAERQALVDEAIQAKAKADKLAEAAAKVAEKNGETVTEEQLSSEEEEIPIEDQFPPATVKFAPYCYTYDLIQVGESGGKVTGEYIELLKGFGFTVVDGFHPIDGVFYEMLSPDYTQRAGTVVVAKKMSWDGQLFVIMVDWTATGAVVSVYNETGTIYIPPIKKVEDENASTSGGSLSIQDALNFITTRNPSDLGLAGATMDDYNVYTLEGLVMVDGVPYRQFDVFADGTGHTNAHVGSYLFSNDGVVLKVDGDIVRPLPITNVHEVVAQLEAQAEANAAAIE